MNSHLMVSPPNADWSDILMLMLPSRVNARKYKEDTR